MEYNSQQIKSQRTFIIFFEWLGPSFTPINSFQIFFNPYNSFIWWKVFIFLCIMHAFYLLLIINKIIESAMDFSKSHKSKTCCKCRNLKGKCIVTSWFKITLTRSCEIDCWFFVYTGRLYSSAVYNDDFEKFSLAEIIRRPVDDLVLQMKVNIISHMCIQTHFRIFRTNYLHHF